MACKRRNRESEKKVQEKEEYKVRARAERIESGAITLKFDFMYYSCLCMVCCSSCHLPKSSNVMIFIVEYLLLCKSKHY